MPNTTEELVAEIIEVEDGDSLTPFIRSANRLVTKFCGSVAAYVTADLEDIETWLAAHFYACFRRQVRGEQAGTVRSDYEGKVDLHLDVTIYGQQAQVLDWNGGLAAWNNSLEDIKNVTAFFYWLGKED